MHSNKDWCALVRAGWILIVALFCDLRGAEPSALEAGFNMPPPETKPWVYWYWISGHISKEGITRDLEAMARIGIGEAMISNVDVDKDARGSVKVLSEPWWQMIEHAIREGGRLGINVAVFNCPGWSQSGGPWIKPEHAMRHIVHGEIAPKIGWQLHGLGIHVSVPVTSP